MGLFDRLRGMMGGGDAAGAVAAEKFECTHEAMTPTWDSADDEGDASKATGFHCPTCDSAFTPQQAEWARKRGTEGSRR